MISGRRAGLIFQYAVVDIVFWLALQIALLDGKCIRKLLLLWNRYDIALRIGFVTPLSVSPVTCNVGNKYDMRATTTTEI